MVSLVVWTLVALAAAAWVMVAASRGTDGSRSGGPREALADVRAGLASWRTRKTTPEATTRLLEPEPVDATFDEFFAAAEVEDDGYLQLDDLADRLLRARDLASRGVGLVRR